MSTQIDPDSRANSGFTPLRDGTSEQKHHVRAGNEAQNQTCRDEHGIGMHPQRSPPILMGTSPGAKLT